MTSYETILPYCIMSHGYLPAKCNGVAELMSLTLLTEAPKSIKHRTASTCPAIAAKWSAVCPPPPRASAQSTETPP